MKKLAVRIISNLTYVCMYSVGGEGGEKWEAQERIETEMSHGIDPSAQQD